MPLEGDTKFKVLKKNYAGEGMTVELDSPNTLEHHQDLLGMQILIAKSDVNKLHYS